MSAIKMSDLNWPSAAALHGGPGFIAVLPLGAIEQHGPHLPLETDSLISWELACAIAGRLSAQVVVGPVIAGGLSTHHLGFAGTVTLPEEALSASVTAFVDTFDRMGATRTAVFSAHGGNFMFLRDLASADERVIAYSSLDGYLGRMFDVARELSVEVPETDVHAGALETSLALYLFPALVEPSFRDVAGCVEAEPGWRERLFAQGVRALSETGVLGAPELATADLGEAVFHGLVDLLAEWISAECAIPYQRR